MVCDTSSFSTLIISKVRRRDNGKLYAVKMMTKERILSNNKRMERAMMERKVLAKARHPFIVTMYWVIASMNLFEIGHPLPISQAFQTRSHLYFVLEFCAGGELFYHMMQRGHFDESTAKYDHVSYCLCGCHDRSSRLVIRLVVILPSHTCPRQVLLL